jgi:hypothetical protein
LSVVAGQAGQNKRFWEVLGERSGTIGGVVAFVGGGLGTVLAAITDWGSDEGGLAAARRNHVDLLVAAASLAVAGLTAGAVYALLRSRGKPIATFALAVGVVFVAAGVGSGIVATTLREPGRPTLGIERVDAESIRISVQAEGLSSDAAFEARVDGFNDKGDFLIDLAAAKFSPSQRGTLDWSQRIAVPPRADGQRLTRVQLWVAKDVRRKGAPPACGSGIPTCLYMLLPTTPEANHAP